MKYPKQLPTHPLLTSPGECLCLGGNGSDAAIMPPIQRGRILPLVLSILAAGLCSLPAAKAADATSAPSPTPASAAVTVPDAASPVMRQIVAQLGGVPIAQASLSNLIKAVKRVVEANPKDVAAIVAGVLSVDRPDMPDIAGQIVGAAIQGLGPDASNLAIGQAVQTGVALQPSAVLAIVRCSVQASKCDAIPTIVQVAKASLGNQKQSDGKNTVPLENQSDSKEIAPIGSRPDGKQITPVASGSNDETLLQIVQTAYDSCHGCYANPATLLSAVSPSGQLPGIGENTSSSSPGTPDPVPPASPVTPRATPSPTPHVPSKPFSPAASL